MQAFVFFVGGKNSIFAKCDRRPTAKLRFLGLAERQYGLFPTEFVQQANVVGAANGHVMRFRRQGHGQTLADRTRRRSGEPKSLLSRHEIIKDEQPRLLGKRAIIKRLRPADDTDEFALRAEDDLMAIPLLWAELVKLAKFLNGLARFDFPYGNGPRPIAIAAAADDKILSVGRNGVTMELFVVALRGEASLLDLLVIFLVGVGFNRSRVKSPTRSLPPVSVTNMTPLPSERHASGPTLLPANSDSFRPVSASQSEMDSWL